MIKKRERKNKKNNKPKKCKMIHDVIFGLFLVTTHYKESETLSMPFGTARDFSLGNVIVLW